jgi:amino acid adenylation domain-containing protein
VQLVVDFAGPLDPGALRAAAHTLLRRHANLRAGFRYVAIRQPVQFISMDVELPWSELDLPAAMDCRAKEAELARLLAEDRERRFDLRCPPLVRGTVIRHSINQARFVLTCHHILLDGWSMPLLMQELLALYLRRGDDAGLPRVTPYKDYLAWLAQQDLGAAEAAWRRALWGVDEPTLLAPAAGALAAAPERVIIALSEELTAALYAVARQNGLTVNTLMQGAWGILLGRLTARDDVIFGASVSGRPADLHGVESMLGLFINTVPVRVQVNPAETLLDMLTRLQDEQSQLIEHHHLGLGAIQRLIGVRELFDTMAVFENYPVHTESLQQPLIDIGVVGVESRDATHYPLSLAAWLLGTRLQLRTSYRPDVLNRATVTQTLASLVRLFEAIVADPKRRVGSVDILDPAERNRLVAGCSGAVRDVPDKTVPGLFEAQAARTPRADAVACEGAGLSYAELSARANQLAHRLIAMGIGPEGRVAILQERSVEMVVSIVAALKAGGAYVPLDPRYPAARMRRILEETSTSVLLTDRVMRERASALPVSVVVVDDDRSLAEEPDHDPGVAVQPGQLAYVMYTSGSTGAPKGVMVTHRDVVGLALDRAFQGGGHERVLLHSPLAFDASTYELWAPLLSGGEVVVAPPGELSLAALERAIAREKVTGLFLSAGLFQLLAEESPTALAGVREVWAGGDVVPASSARRLLDRCPNLTVVDGYGPTETTTFATRHILHRGEPLPSTIPIGRPLDNRRVYVLDSALRPAPPDVVGDFYIAGVGVARGYLERRGLTAERFVADPFGPPGSRMYRTGDRGRLRADGSLELAGRVDQQVKVRGFRIELGEIEAALAGHADIAQVVVAVREDEPGDKRIVAYVAPIRGKKVSASSLSAHVTAILPSFMVPSAFVVLDSLPLTPNGKVDREALPAPDVNRVIDAPRTPREEALCGLFAEVLGLPGVGVDDSFFALGGHSLLTARLVSRIRSAFGVELSIRTLFENPTVAGLARRLGMNAKESTLGVLLRLRAGQSRAPLFCMHPAAGISWVYGGLLRYLGPSTPVYGLQARGLEQPTLLPKTVDEMAADYLAELRTIQPTGPYHLLGWSFGGVVAHVVATRLQAEGEEVALLAMMDAYPLRGRAELSQEQATAAVVQSLGHALAPHGEEPLERAQVSAILRRDNSALATLTDSQLSAMVQVFVHNIKIGAAFTPGVFHGDLLFFTAAEGRTADSPEFNAWAPHITGTIENHGLPCQHREMTQPEPLATIGRVLSAKLSQVEGRSQNSQN